MGSEVGLVNSNETTLKDYLEELCAYAISIGMSYHDFWYGDISMFKFYYRAEQFRLKKLNEEKWLQGMYIYTAIGRLAPILNGLSKEKKAKPYLKKPIPITEEEITAQQNQKVQNFKNYMMQLTKGGKKDNG